MGDDELKQLFRITAVGFNKPGRFEGKNLQNSVLKKVVQKWENREVKLKGRGLDLINLCYWISLGIPLAIRSNWDDLFVEKKALRLTQLFNSLYRKAILNEITIKRA
jgi:hypothetical protein